MAPWMRFATWPLRNTSSVGMARIWYSEAVWRFSSVFSFTILRSSRSAAISSRIGATTRHGPHHGAQKSTSTGWSASMTSAWKLVSVTSLILPAMGEGLLGRREGVRFRKYSAPVQPRVAVRSSPAQQRDPARRDEDLDG